MSDSAAVTTGSSEEASRVPVLGGLFSLAGRSAARLTLLFCVVLVPVVLGAKGLQHAGSPHGARALEVLAALLGAPFLLGVGVLQALALSEGRTEALRESVHRSVDRLTQSLCLLVLVTAACAACVVPVVLGDALNPGEGPNSPVERTWRSARMPGQPLPPGNPVSPRSRAGQDPGASVLSAVLLLGALVAGTSVLVCAGPAIGVFYRKNLRPIDAAVAGFELSSGRRLQVGKIVLVAIASILLASIALGVMAQFVPRALVVLVIAGGALAYVLTCALCATTYRLISGT